MTHTIEIMGIDSRVTNTLVVEKILGWSFLEGGTGLGTMTILLPGNSLIVTDTLAKLREISDKLKAELNSQWDLEEMRQDVHARAMMEGVG